MEHHAAPVPDDEPAVQDTELRRWHREEIHGGDAVRVVAQESEPPITLVGPGGTLWHVTRDRGLRDRESKLKKLAMDAGRTPPIARHTDDEITDLAGNTGTSCCPRLRYPGPVSAETPTVPSDHGLRLHDDQTRGPTRPSGSEAHPEASVAVVERRPRTITSEGSHLLAQGQILEHQVGPRPRQGADGLEDQSQHKEEDAFAHATIIGSSGTDVTSLT